MRLIPTPPLVSRVTTDAAGTPAVDTTIAAIARRSHPVHTLARHAHCLPAVAKSTLHQEFVELQAAIPLKVAASPRNAP